MDKITKIWPEWTTEKEIGRGSYGTVYKCVKRGTNIEEYAAVKVISVPQNEAEMSEVLRRLLKQNIKLLQKSNLATAKNIGQ